MGSEVMNFFDAAERYDATARNRAVQAAGARLAGEIVHGANFPFVWPDRDGDFRRDAENNTRNGCATHEAGLKRNLTRDCCSNTLASLANCLDNRAEMGSATSSFSGL